MIECNVFILWQQLRTNMNFKITKMKKKKKDRTMFKFLITILLFERPQKGYNINYTEEKGKLLRGCSISGLDTRKFILSFTF